MSLLLLQRNRKKKKEDDREELGRGRDMCGRDDKTKTNHGLGKRDGDIDKLKDKWLDK